MFAYFFEQGTKESVLATLAFFQNEDGGFGRGLEPDFFYEGSSSLATSIALRYLYQLDVPSDHELVKRSIRYLLETVDREKGQWRRVPYEVNLAPHAGWWHQEEEMESYSGNATAEIIGYLHRYSEWVPASFLESVTWKSLAYLYEQAELEMHEFLCYLNMAPHLPSAEKERVLKTLKPMAPTVIETNPANWKEYGLQPFQAVDSKESPVYAWMSDAVDRNWDYQIQHQRPEGGWSPHWSWGEDSVNWEIAKKHWIGILTVEMLNKLAAFDRLEHRGESSQ